MTRRVLDLVARDADAHHRPLGDERAAVAVEDSPRAFATLVVPSRVPGSSFGCTTVGDQRTFHVSPDRRRRSLQA